MEYFIFFSTVGVLCVFWFVFAELSRLQSRINDLSAEKVPYHDWIYNHWLNGTLATRESLKIWTNYLDRMDSRLALIEKQVIQPDPIPEPKPTLVDRLSALESKKGKNSK